MKIGDAVTVPGEPRCEGFIVEVGRWREGSWCVFVDFYGDGMYLDYYEKDLQPVEWTDLSWAMKQDLIKFRQKEYLKKGGDPQ